MLSKLNGKKKELELPVPRPLLPPPRPGAPFLRPPSVAELGAPPVGAVGKEDEENFKKSVLKKHGKEDIINKIHI